MIRISSFHATLLCRRFLFLAVCLWALVAPSIPTAMAATSPYGVLVNQIDHSTSQATIAAYMDRAKQAGAGWVRVDFWWYSVEWSQGQWNWHYFDYVVQEATSRGLGVIPILWGTPTWAATDGVFSYGVPDMTAWQTFVANTASRYKGSISTWEIWNEPDTTNYWRGTPGKYAQLLALAARQLRAVDPANQVVLGGLAQGGSRMVSNFLQSILADPTYPAGAYFDVHNIHTNFRSMSGIVDQINSNKTILANYGLSKSLAVTEASYTSDPAYQTLSGYGGGESGQAAYLTDAYHAMLSNGVGVAVWACLKNYSTSSGAYTESGLVRTDLTPKAAYTAFQQLAGGSTTTTPPPPPTTLTISSIAVSTNPHSATVQWTTNAPADSRVDYGTTSSFGRVVTSSTRVTSHSVQLSGLARRTTYYARITSRAADGTTATSATFTFRTR